MMVGHFFLVLTTGDVGDGRLPIRPRFRRVCAYTHSFTWNWRQSGNSRLGLAQRKKKKKKRALTRKKKKNTPQKHKKNP